MVGFQIGAASVTRIFEFIDHAEPAAEFFLHDFDEQVFAQHRSWLRPRFLEPGTDSVLLHMQSWLVRTPRHTILIDSCCGNHKERPGPGWEHFHQLNTGYMDRFKETGVGPEDVDFVLCTHLHVDHVGWNSRLDNGRWVPTFPNAKYVMARAEHDFWAEAAKDEATPIVPRNIYNDSVLPVVEAGLAELIDGSGSVGDVLTIHPAPGHTPGHFHADLLSQGKRAMFIGDILHSPVQIPLWRWSSRFCVDAEKAKESRREVLALCAERGDLLIPAHFGEPHAGYVKAAGDEFEIDFRR